MSVVGEARVSNHRAVVTALHRLQQGSRRWAGNSDRPIHTQTGDARTHDDAVAECSPVLELQGLEDVPELLRHGSAVLVRSNKSQVQSPPAAAASDDVCSESPQAPDRTEGRALRPASVPVGAWSRGNAGVRGSMGAGGRCRFRFQGDGK